ncbi:DUF397 domain-containing protein [Streptomyces avermitilis]
MSHPGSLLRSRPPALTASQSDIEFRPDRLAGRGPVVYAQRSARSSASCAVPGDGTRLEWFKSSYSSGEPGPDCVEVAAAPGTVRIRDSKNKKGAQLAFPRGPVADFVAYASKS